MPERVDTLDLRSGPDVDRWARRHGGWLKLTGDQRDALQVARQRLAAQAVEFRTAGYACAAQDAALAAAAITRGLTSPAEEDRKAAEQASRDALFGRYPGGAR